MLFTNKEINELERSIEIPFSEVENIKIRSIYAEDDCSEKIITIEYKIELQYNQFVTEYFEFNLTDYLANWTAYDLLNGDIRAEVLTELDNSLQNDVNDKSDRALEDIKDSLKQLKGEL